LEGFKVRLYFKT